MHYYFLNSLQLLSFCSAVKMLQPVTATMMVEVINPLVNKGAGCLRFGFPTFVWR
jgi:hypothetical protein